MMRRATGLIAAALLVGSATAAAAVPGDLDSGFSADGLLVTDLGLDAAQGDAIAVDTDGRIVVAGQVSTSGTRDVLVMRLLPDGSLDPEFSDDGYVTTDIGGALESVSDVAIDGAGNIVVATLQSTLLRYTPAGSLDSTFGSGGMASIAIKQARSLAIDDDGSIVVGGDFDLARYLADGTPDPDFGDNGIVDVEPGFLVWAVAIDSQDRIIVGGSDFIDLDVYDGVVARFTPNGGLDASFADEGVALLDSLAPSMWINDVAIGEDDVILGATTLSGFTAPVIRLTSDGDLDTAFSADGIASIDTDKEITVGSVAVDRHGNVVVAGAIEGLAPQNDYDLLVIRYRSNGTPDVDFSEDGIAAADPGENRAGAGAVAIDADGNIVVTGSTSGDQTSDLAVARFQGYRPDDRFVDDDDSVFEADIEALERAGITAGCNPPVNDKYCPDGSVNRGQMAAFLVRALGYTDSGDGDLFTDDDGSVFEVDIDKLATAGVTLGCNPPVNDRYCPNQPVTRGQMAAFLVRALGYTDSGDGDLFTDDDGSIFEADIDKLATAGVTAGCNPPTNDRYCPNNPVTRGQMAAFLVRALDLE